MVDWFLIIFESNTDKARLITIVISTIIAILIFLLTQYFVNQRKRKELLIEKIEELYKSVVEYEKHAIILYKDINKKPKVNPEELNPYKRDDDYYPTELMDNVNNEVRNLKMLIGLYFNHISFNENKFYAGETIPILEVRIKSKFVSADKYLELNEDSKDNIMRNVNVIKDICYDLMKKHSF